MSSWAGPLRGDIANLYQVGPGLLKIARDPADNDLMRREALALATLRDQVEPRFRAYFPQLGAGAAAARSAARASSAAPT